MTGVAGIALLILAAMMAGRGAAGMLAAIFLGSAGALMLLGSCS
jgi:hypothetical protein